MNNLNNPLKIRDMSIHPCYLSLQIANNNRRIKIQADGQRYQFRNLAMKDSMYKNRHLARVMDIAVSIEWNDIENVLMSRYTVGTSHEGADAYPTLLLYKCLMLQKWFHIDSVPELESQINDRVLFKIIGPSFDDPSPGHSTFSRFRKRLLKKAIQ